MNAQSASGSHRRISPRPQVDFSQPVPENGYVWWYADALSDDGRHGITIIAMLGSVFSPYYAAARRRGRADPVDHCALNVALYGAVGKRWSMTERSRAAVQRECLVLRIGSSSMRWEDSGFTIEIDEITAPLPSRVRGRVRIQPVYANEHVFALDRDGQHHWRPIAPLARFDVQLQKPLLNWNGNGYVDSNHGSVPLEQTFASWQWSRSMLADGATAVLYDVCERSGHNQSLAVCFAPDTAPFHFTAPPQCRLPNTAWRLGRWTRSEHGHARLLQTLEDTPFYARSLLSGRLLGQSVISMHESLSVTRFDTRWVQWLLPFRMPRWSF